MEAINSTRDAKTRTVIYIGNLDVGTTEPLLCALFAQFGNIKSCKILNDGSGSKFAFIEYNDQQTAEMAISTMHRRVFLGRTIKVNWANQPYPGNGASGGRDKDRSNHYAIWVGDVSNDLTETELQSAFSQFGSISDVRIIRDPVTMKCKNYGFVTFIEQQAALNAIETMNGSWLGSRAIRTNWAQKKTMMDESAYEQEVKQKLTYREIDCLSSPTNSTVYCGNMAYGLSESILESMFSRFGTICDIRVFPEKGYGFVSFSKKKAAVKAIIEMNQTEFQGSFIKVAWGKEQNRGSTSSVANTGEALLPLPQYAQPDYWQQVQNYQHVYAMCVQQQMHHYNTNATAPSSSVYPYYFGNHYAQVPLTSPAGTGMNGGGYEELQNQQSSSIRSYLA